MVQGGFLAGEVERPLQPCSLPDLIRFAVPETFAEVEPGSANLPVSLVSKYSHVFGIWVR